MGVCLRTVLKKGRRQRTPDVGWTLASGSIDLPWCVETMTNQTFGDTNQLVVRIYDELRQLARNALAQLKSRSEKSSE